MKMVHIEARIRDIVKLPKPFIDKLPKKVAVFTTIQLIDSLDAMITQIKESGREAVVFKTGHTRHKGQILGCNVQKWSDYADADFDAFVYVGDGLFHPKALIWENTDRKVFAYNPFSDEQFVLDSKDVEKHRMRHKAALSRFILANKVGVLVTTKPGQFILKRAFELEQEYPEKEFFYVIDNTINFQSLEDFPFIEIWVNTACPRIGFDDSIKITKPIINMEEIKKKNPKRALIK